MDVNKERWISVSDKVGLVCRNADHPHTEYATRLLIMENWQESPRFPLQRDTVIMGLLNAACDKCAERIIKESK